MVIFHSFLYVYQRVPWFSTVWSMENPLFLVFSISQYILHNFPETEGSMDLPPWMALSEVLHEGGRQVPRGRSGRPVGLRQDHGKCRRQNGAKRCFSGWVERWMKDGWVISQTSSKNEVFLMIEFQLSWLIFVERCERLDLEELSHRQTWTVLVSSNFSPYFLAIWHGLVFWKILYW